MKLLVVLAFFVLSCGRVDEKSDKRNVNIKNIHSNNYTVEFQNSEGRILKGGRFYLREMSSDGELIKTINNGAKLVDGQINLVNLPTNYQIGFIGENSFEYWFAYNYKLMYGKNIIKIEKSGAIEGLITINSTSRRFNDYVILYYDKNGILNGGIGLLLNKTSNFEIYGIKEGHYILEVKKNYESKDCLYRSEVIRVTPGKKSKVTIIL